MDAQRDSCSDSGGSLHFDGAGAWLRRSELSAWCHTRGMSRRPVVRCLLTAMLFGAAAPAASVLAEKMPTLVLAGLLYVGASLGGDSVCRSAPAHQ